MSYRCDQLAVCADYVKEHVSALDTGHALGLDIKRGRCKCPIHGGHDYNCVLYPGNRGYVCHTCKSGGDVIRLVRETNTGMSFSDALRWFNSMFDLGMNIDSHVDEKRLKQAKNRLKRKEQERAFRERVDKARYDMFLSTDKALERLEQQRDDNRPRTYNEPWNDAFVEAVRLIPIVRQYTEDFAMECVR